MIFPSSRAWLRLSGIAQRVETVVRESVRELGDPHRLPHLHTVAVTELGRGRRGRRRFKRCDGETAAVEAS